MKRLFVKGKEHEITGLKPLHDIALLYRRNFIQTFRIPVWLGVSFSTPLLYLALFTPLLKDLPAALGLPAGNVLDLFLPGILVLMAFGSGVSAGFGVIFELQAGFTERLRVTPASRFALLAGPILAGLTWTYFFVTLIVVVAMPFGFDVHVLGLLIAYVLLGMLMMMFSAFSVAVALMTKEISSFAAVVNGINLPLILLAGVLLPMTLAPTWMNVIAHFNPMYYVVEAARHLAGGTLWDLQIAAGFLVMVPLTVLALAWATRVYRRAVA